MNKIVVVFVVVVKRLPIPIPPGKKVLPEGTAGRVNLALLISANQV